MQKVFKLLRYKQFKFDSILSKRYQNLLMKQKHYWGESVSYKNGILCTKSKSDVTITRCCRPVV